MAKGAATGTSSTTAASAKKVSLNVPQPNVSKGDGEDSETARRHVEEEAGWRAAATTTCRGPTGDGRDGYGEVSLASSAPRAMAAAEAASPRGRLHGAGRRGGREGVEDAVTEGSGEELS